MREQILAVLLAMAAAFIVAGVATFSSGVGLIAGGLLWATWSWLFFGDIRDDSE